MADNKKLKTLGIEILKVVEFLSKIYVEIEKPKLDIFLSC